VAASVAAALAVVAPNAMPPNRVAAAATPAKSFLNFMRNPLFLYFVLVFCNRGGSGPSVKGLRDPQIFKILFCYQPACRLAFV